MVTGKRYAVFSMRELKERDGNTSTTWVRAGSAWLNRDGSLNVYLDVLPIDGRLQVREAVERKEVAVEARAA